MKYIIKLLAVVLTFSLFLPALPAVFAEDAESDFCEKVKNATCDDDLDELSKNPEIKNCDENIMSKFNELLGSCEKDVEKKINQTDQKVQNIKTAESAVSRALGNISWDIKKLNTEIADLNLSISQIGGEIKKREESISELNKAYKRQKEILSETIRQVYEYDSNSYVEILIGYGTVSDFSDKLEEMERLQANLQSAMKEISAAKKKMEKDKTELEKKKEEQIQYKEVQAMSKQSLAAQQDRQQSLLNKLSKAKTPLEEQIIILEDELTVLKSAMGRIKSYLISTLGYNVGINDIFNAVRDASKQTGLRPAFLLAILENEASINKPLSNKGSREENIQQCVDMCHPGNCTRVGTNTDGRRCWFVKCVSFNQPQIERLNWCTSQQNALERICGKLGLNPNDSNKVRITMDYGMGPSQFQPTTWEGRGFSGNPWSLNSAVLSMAIKLGGGSEWSMAKSYNGGSNYADRAVRRAKEWQSIIDVDVCGFSLDCPQLKEKLKEEFE